jgi:phosphopantothenoylcysteine decarboxylase/phosphopantothenate--cysteine ligase
MKTVLITAGPTREYLDPVRFFSNPSTGKMGYALARAAHAKGAKVILISGPVALRPPRGVKLIEVETGNEMFREVMQHYEDADAVIMAAAVVDYSPKRRMKGKMKKVSQTMNIRMQRTRDILANLGQRKGKQFLVGFAAETGLLIKEATNKLKRKNLDMIVANDVSKPQAGFASDYNSALIIDRTGVITDYPRMKKDKLARFIIKHCFEKMNDSASNDD